MLRAIAIFIVICLISILGSGCRTYSPETQAVWKKYLMVKPGMTRSEVFAIVGPAPTARTVGGGELASWIYGTPFANADYANMDVLFGKDGRVIQVHREMGHGHTPHDSPILSAPPNC